MEIQVQCTNGDAARLAIEDERNYMDLIESIRPLELFHQPLLRIQAGKRTSLFNMKAVESILFATPLKAKIREYPVARNLATISKMEFLEELDHLRRKYELNENIYEPGNSIVTLGTIHCVSGRMHYLQAELIARHRVEQLMDLHNLLERLTSVIPCRPEGYIAINPDNIKRIEIYPAPQETMLTAWLVDKFEDDLSRASPKPD